VVPFEPGLGPNGICFSPDASKVYLVRGGGLHVGDVRATKLPASSLSPIAWWTAFIAARTACALIAPATSGPARLRRWAMPVSRCGIRRAN